MKYRLVSKSSAVSQGNTQIGANNIKFGVTKQSELPSPAELLVAAFAACCLKNIERFSEMMKFEYNHAEIIVNAERQDKPPMINVITYEIEINSSDSKLNKDLLLRNIQKFGTIYNTLNVVCKISGDIKVVR
ncbi:MAG: OsmC family protein [Flavobacteriales bacterium]|nr:OsmC family protein [Flavobacteriales bacterium]